MHVTAAFCGEGGQPIVQQAVRFVIGYQQWPQEGIPARDKGQDAHGYQSRFRHRHQNLANVFHIAGPIDFRRFVIGNGNPTQITIQVVNIKDTGQERNDQGRVGVQ